MSLSCDLVRAREGARPLCYPWQCKVISRTDFARDVTDGDGNPVHVYAQSETTYGEPAGLFGINCGHHPMLFIPGASKVPALNQTEAQNAETYAQSQKQRKLERDFRKAAVPRWSSFGCQRRHFHPLGENDNP